MKSDFINKVLRVLVVILCAVLLITPLIGGHYYVGVQNGMASPTLLSAIWQGDAPPLAEMLIGVPIIISFGIILIGIPVMRYPAGKLMLALGTFWLWLVMSVMNAPQPHFAIMEALKWTVGYVTFLVVCALAGRGSSARAMLVCIASAATVCSIYAVWVYSMSVQSDPTYRAFSTFFNPDYFAGYLCLTLSITAGLLVGALDSGKLLFGAMFCAQALALILSGSRFGFLAATASIILFIILLFWHRALNKQIIIRLGAAILTTAALVGIFAFRFHTVPGLRSVSSSNVDNHSKEFRLWTWRGTVRMIRSSPYSGTGIGTYQYEYPKYSYVNSTLLAHSSPLQLAAETGIIGLILFVISGLLWLKYILQREKEIPLVDNKQNTMLQDNPRIYRSCAAAGVLGLLLHSFVDSDLSIYSSLISFYAAAGLAVSFAVDGIFPENLPSVFRKSLGIITAPILAVAVSILGMASYYEWHGQLELQNARGKEDITSALEDLDKANHLAINNPDYMDAEGETTLAFGIEDPSKYETGLTFYKKAMMVAPSYKTYIKYAFTLDYLGTKLNDSNKYIDALKNARLALEYNPNSIEAMQLVETLYTKVKDDLHAIEYAKKIVDAESSTAHIVRATPEFIDTRFGEAHWFLAQNHIKNKEYNSAMHELLGAETVYEKYNRITRKLLRKYITPEALEANPHASIAGYSVETDIKAMENYIKVLEAEVKIYNIMHHDSEAASTKQKLLELSNELELVKR